jgi:hypothetical protein
MKMSRRPRRIYYGPPGAEKSLWWTVKVTDAKKPVKVNGSVLHALRGHPGVTIGCGLSNMAIDKANAEAFPHPVHLASFTSSTALMVDRLSKDGSPAHAVLYCHSYGHITDRNDKGTLKRLVREDPTIMERPFVLRAPRKSSRSGVGAGKTPRDQRGKSDRARAFVPRGALARAVKAGRIGRHVAEQLNTVAANRTPEPVVSAGQLL